MKELTWRDGATMEGIPAPVSKAKTPAAGAGEPLDCEVLSIPQLIAQKVASGDLATFKTRVLALCEQDSQALIARIATTGDTLTLWFIHLTLDKRGIAPALRWPANDDSQQSEFITFAADLLWLSRRYPDHKPNYRGWARALAHQPPSPHWHAAVHRQYLFAAPRYSLAHYCSKALALAERQRQELMTLPTATMASERRQLQSERFTELRERLLTHAMGHRDKAGKHQPHDIANRRAALWRTYVLCGKCKATTTHNWHLLTSATTGKPITRQALAKQLVIIEGVLGGRP